MKASRCLITIALILWSQSSYSGADSSPSCQPNTMAVYRMSLMTSWTEQLFPKNYPKWRPPAQWSQVFGQTHGRKHSIFRIGKKSSWKLKNFAERANLQGLSQTISKDSIFDQFLSPAILKGDGKSEQDFFTISNYSKLSVVCRMIPSPDWFIGIDSLELCLENQWIENINITVDLLDAGTQGGLTFTAPRWRLQDPRPVERITSRNPYHRAASFYYPDLDRLPTIATFSIEKIKEYNLDESTTDFSFNDTSFEENNETFYYNDSYFNSSNSMSGIRLLIEAERIASNVTENFKKNDKYFPKLFRPRIETAAADPKKSNSYTSGNLLKSKLPPNKSVKASSYFSW